MPGEKEHVISPSSQLKPSSTEEWRVFEHQFGRWLRDNARMLTADEGIPLKKATYDCLIWGLGSGVALGLALRKSVIRQKAVACHAISAITGFYVTAVCMNHKRRPLYTTFLNSPGRAGDAARDILQKTRASALSTTSSDPNLGDLHFVDHAPVFESHGDKTSHDKEWANPMQEARHPEHDVHSSDTVSSGARLVSKIPGTYKTWDDIRKENQPRK
ncbi:hypothetical protein X943_004015 [Babesia divergens]|uniref:Uncharacterized protein n=1 Tax=Babesia divergens TaxID=32595 RepID=A0AAD9GI05_BABDI|nr:hypothetical protein X943_004015 [Babesia divergens]